jgi:hypothetical protein
MRSFAPLCWCALLARFAGALCWRALPVRLPARFACVPCPMFPALACCRPSTMNRPPVDAAPLPFRHALALAAAALWTSPAPAQVNPPAAAASAPQAAASAVPAAPPRRPPAPATRPADAKTPAQLERVEINGTASDESIRRASTAAKIVITPRGDRALRRQHRRRGAQAPARRDHRRPPGAAAATCACAAWAAATRRSSSTASACRPASRWTNCRPTRSSASRCCARPPPSTARAPSPAPSTSC